MKNILVVTSTKLEEMLLGGFRLSCLDKFGVTIHVQAPKQKEAVQPSRSRTRQKRKSLGGVFGIMHIGLMLSLYQILYKKDRSPARTTMVIKALKLLAIKHPDLFGRRKLDRPVSSWHTLQMLHKAGLIEHDTTSHLIYRRGDVSEAHFFKRVVARSAKAGLTTDDIEGCLETLQAITNKGRREYDI